MTYQEFCKYNASREERINWREIYNKYIQQVNEICLRNIKNFEKLIKSQKEAIQGLAFKMFKHYLTEEYITNHYEIFSDNVAGKEEYKKYRIMEDNNIFLASGSSSTFRNLEKRGLIKIIEDGGKYIDEISPLFQLDFSNIEL
jgi:hypothetical protein